VIRSLLMCEKVSFARNDVFGCEQVSFVSKQASFVRDQVSFDVWKDLIFIERFFWCGTIFL